MPSSSSSVHRNRSESRVTFNLPSSRPGTMNTNRARGGGGGGRRWKETEEEEEVDQYTADKDLIDLVFGRPDANATHHDPAVTDSDNDNDSDRGGKSDSTSKRRPPRRLPPRSCAELPRFPLLPRVNTETPTDTDATIVRLEQYMREFDRVFPGVSHTSGEFDSPPERPSCYGDSHTHRGESCNRSKCSHHRPGGGGARSRSQAAGGRRWSHVKGNDQYELARHKLNARNPIKPTGAKASRSPARRRGAAPSGANGSRLFRSGSEPMLRRKKANAAKASRTPELNQNGAHFATNSRGTRRGGGRKSAVPMRNGGVLSRQQRDLRGRPQWQSSATSAASKGGGARRQSSRQSVHDQFRELAKDHYRHIASTPSLRELASRSVRDELTSAVASVDASPTKTAKTKSSSPSKAKGRSTANGGVKSKSPAVTRQRRSTPSSGATSKRGFRGGYAQRSPSKAQKSMTAQAYARSRPKVGACEVGAKNFARVASRSPVHREGGSQPSSTPSSAQDTARRLRKTLYFVPAQYQ